MNIYQIDNNNLIIDNYDYPKLTLDDLSKIEINSIEQLFGGNILELVDCDLFLDLLSNKLRLRGEFIITGINIDNLCEQYLDHTIDINFINQMFVNKKYLYNLPSLIETIKKNKFITKYIKTDGIYYYMVIVRDVPE